MSKVEKLIAGLFGIIAFLFIGIGIAAILLYRQGDIFSHVVVFLTIFGTFFLISDIQKNDDKNNFYNDIFSGIAATLILLIIRFVGDNYEVTAIFSAFIMYGILFYKLEQIRKSQRR